MSLRNFIFSRSRRMTKKLEFTSMYSSASKRTVGPLLIHRKENSLGHSRLGLSVPKRVGNAVQRNKIKRLCREAFRVSATDLKSVDVLITIRPHTPKTLAEYIEYISIGTQK
jgi:ribonuclease P protein component